MPRFYRRTFRRFSATPRRRFGSRLQGTLTPRMQVCQFNVQQDFFITSNGGNLSQPAFYIQAMSPWNNLSQSGYDRSMSVHGIVWNLDCWVLENHPAAGGTLPGPGTGIARAFMPIASEWFVDAAEAATQAPVSYLQSPYGPFQTTPPVAAPGGASPDSEVFPTRILKRKSAWMCVEVISPTPLASTVRAESATDVSSWTRFQWSGVLRKRFAVDDRQGLYWGLFAVSPTTSDYTLAVQFNGHYYYRLKR